jgi:hypothetical protein
LARDAVVKNAKSGRKSVSVGKKSSRSIQYILMG